MLSFGGHHQGHDHRSQGVLEAQKLSCELKRSSEKISVASKDVSVNETRDTLGRATVALAIDEFRLGRPVLVSDDADRENEGDVILAGELATRETIAFMVRYTSGVICVAMPGDRLDELGLPPMVSRNEDPKGTAFTVSVDVKDGITTGISASERARTIRALSDPSSKASDFHRPGHLFPLRAKPGGVLERDGHTEAAVDLARLAKLAPAGALSEVVREDDGDMARSDYLETFRRQHNLVLTTIADLKNYRLLGSD